MAESDDLCQLMETYREKIFERLWNSTLFLEKTSKAKETVFERTAKKCQEAITGAGIGIKFNKDAISKVLDEPVPDWYGDANEPSDALWWDEIRTKVLAETSLAGLGPTPALSSLLEVDLTLLSSSPPEASG